MRSMRQSNIEAQQLLVEAKSHETIALNATEASQISRRKKRKNRKAGSLPAEGSTASIPSDMNVASEVGGSSSDSSLDDSSLQNTVIELNTPAQGFSKDLFGDPSDDSPPATNEEPPVAASTPALLPVSDNHQQFTTPAISETRTPKRSFQELSPSHTGHPGRPPLQPKTQRLRTRQNRDL